MNSFFTRLVRLMLVAAFLYASIGSAQEKPAPKSEPVQTDSAKRQPPQDQSASKPASGPAVDAVKLSGSSFESPYFKFTYELPAGWKTLDDAARLG